MHLDAFYHSPQEPQELREMYGRYRAIRLDVQRGVMNPVIGEEIRRQLESHIVHLERLLGR